MFGPLSYRTPLIHSYPTRYKLSADATGSEEELCDLNDAYAEVWEAHGRTEYQRVAVTITKMSGASSGSGATAVYSLNAADAKYSTSTPAGANVALGTAEDCYADSAVHSFSCASQGRAVIDLGGP